MKTKKSPPIVELQQWFNSDAGHYIQTWEQARIENLVANVFGYRAVQYGLPAVPYLQNNRIPLQIYAGPQRLTQAHQANWQTSVVCEAEQLPFDRDSIDLLILPHALSSVTDQHMVLREAQRVLVPEGRLILTGFNPWSLWGLRNRLPACGHAYPASENGALSPARLKDWLRLLSFEIDRGHFGCYAPPVQTAQWFERFDFLEKAGDRWWPVFGAVYIVSAVKRVTGMRLITPAWKRKTQRRKARAAVTAKEVQTNSLNSLKNPNNL